MSRPPDRPPREPRRPERRPEGAPLRHKKPLSHVGRAAPMRFAGDPLWRDALERAFRPPPGFDERALSHGFHAWPARLHPHIARALIPLAPEGAAIADPFMGSGTTPLEALVAGRQAVGSDLNPIGFEVAWTRTRRSGPPLVGRAKALVSEAQALAAGAPGAEFVAFQRAVGDWFDAQALGEVYALRCAVLASLAARPDDVGRILRAVLSSILVKLSRQVSDSVTRIDRTAHGRSPPGRVFEWFVGRAAELEGQLRDLARALPPRAPEPIFHLGDARVAPAGLPPLGAIITSPPYPGVYDYLRHHLLRLTVLGLDAARAAKDEIGARRAHEREGREKADARYVDDMAAVLASWSQGLVAGGFWALVVGDGQDKSAVIPVLPMVAEAARRAGLVVRASLSDPRPTFGLPDAPTRAPAVKAAAKEEHLVILTRSA